VPTGEYNRSVCESPVAVWAVPIVTVATLFLVAFVFSNPFFHMLFYLHHSFRKHLRCIFYVEYYVIYCP